MFGFSITKLLFTIAVVFVVWKGFKWFNRLREKYAANAGSNHARGNKRQTSKNNGASGVSNAEEMTKCATCETYFSAAGAVFCGKDGCPYPS
jgi:hypothetical protein